MQLRLNEPHYTVAMKTMIGVRIGSADGNN